MSGRFGSRRLASLVRITISDCPVMVPELHSRDLQLPFLASPFFHQEEDHGRDEEHVNG